MPQYGAKARVAFRCPHCKQRCGDPAYHGPWPHAPGRLCFGCWAEQWSQFERRFANGGDWTVLDEALWLVCMGFTFTQASHLVAGNRRFLARWLQRMRKHPHLIPDWLAKAGS